MDAVLARRGWSNAGGMSDNARPARKLLDGPRRQSRQAAGSFYRPPDQAARAAISFRLWLSSKRRKASHIFSGWRLVTKEGALALRQTSKVSQTCEVSTPATAGPDAHAASRPPAPHARTRATCCGHVSGPRFGPRAATGHASASSGRGMANVLANLPQDCGALTLE